MDLVLVLIVVGILLSMLGTLAWWVIVFFVARAAIKGIAHSAAEFQGMSVQQQLATLQHLQAVGRLDVGRQYLGSVEGPVTSEIRHIAASEGISLDF